jgi:hypothetical protein
VVWIALQCLANKRFRTRFVLLDRSAQSIGNIGDEYACEKHPGIDRTGVED